jgi:hypothetical protein
VPNHPGLAQGEGGENADDVELDELFEVCLEGDDEADGCQGEQDDPVAVDEPVSSVG